MPCLPHDNVAGERIVMPRFHKIPKVGSRIVINNDPSKWGFNLFITGEITGTVTALLKDGVVQVMIDEQCCTNKELGMVQAWTFYKSEIVRCFNAKNKTKAAS